jgi:hypothetical protein
MLWFLCATLIASQGGTILPAPVDVAALKLGAPTTIVEIDTDKLKGDPRRLAWSADHTELYLQTVEGKPPSQKLHHYRVAVDGKTVSAIDAEPEWAAAYWAVKQDRVAPGLPLLLIDVETKEEIIKSGPGPAGTLNRESNPTSVGMSNPSADSLAAGSHGDQKAMVVRLRLVGEEIAAFTNEPQVRGLIGTRFGWGPSGSGALVYRAESGGLVLLDQFRHRQKVPVVKDAILPAWSTDGSRLAYLQRTGRKTFAVGWVTIAAN